MSEDRINHRGYSWWASYKIMFEYSVKRFKRAKDERTLKALNLWHRTQLEQERKRCLEDEDGDEDQGIDCSHSEFTEQIKDIPPEDTFETWVLEREINISTFINQQQQHEEPRHGAQGDDDDNDDEADTDFGSDDDTLEKARVEYEGLRNLTRSSELSNARTQFMVRVRGLEVLPAVSITNMDKQSDLLSTETSYLKRHAEVLNKIMHLCVLRQDWRRAYRCFTLLIRCNNIDILSIWPIGLEVITRVAELEYIESGNDGSEYNLRVYGTDSSPLKIFKDEQFLLWLLNFYPGSKVLDKHRVLHLALRGGTADTAPYFVVTLIWTIIMKRNFTMVNDKLSEMLSKKPFIRDGVFYFLQGLSYQLEASTIVNSEPDSIDQGKVLKLVNSSQKFLEEAKTLGAEFPEKLIQNELDLIKLRLSELDDSD